MVVDALFQGVKDRKPERGGEVHLGLAHCIGGGQYQRVDRHGLRIINEPVPVLLFLRSRRTTSMASTAGYRASSNGSRRRVPTSSACRRSRPPKKNVPHARSRLRATAHSGIAKHSHK